LLAAAERLRLAGRTAAVITNDQGEGLVDTRLVEAAGFPSQEVAGGCFCCRFSDLVESAARLQSSRPDVIFAEPVGSCTDLAATVVRPLQRLFRDRLRPAPLTVLVDPRRAEQLLRPDGEPNLAYLFRKQLAEADLVRFSKADRRSAAPVLDGVHAQSISAHTGEGVAEWLEEVLEGDLPAGVRQLEVDYRRYADAEAALGWLNWQADLRLPRPLTPASVAGPFLERFDQSLTKAGVEIAHLKIFVRSAGGYVRAGLCANGDEPSVDGLLDAPPALNHRLTLNLRAVASPVGLLSVLESAARELPGRLHVFCREAFHPSAPKPEHRFTEP
jgi:hypothetical protein